MNNGFKQNGNAPDRVNSFLPTRPSGNITIFYFGLNNVSFLTSFGGDAAGSKPFFYHVGFSSFGKPAIN